MNVFKIYRLVVLSNIISVGHRGVNLIELILADTVRNHEIRLRKSVYTDNIPSPNSSHNRIVTTWRDSDAVVHTTTRKPIEFVECWKFVGALFNVEIRISCI